jgi:hypothetical protein
MLKTLMKVIMEVVTRGVTALLSLIEISSRDLSEAKRRGRGSDLLP